MYQGTTLQNDSDTQATLFDWFQFRELNYEDDKFLVMYKRNLDMYYPKYKLLLEDELKQLPSLDNFKSEITGQLRNYGSITDELARIIKRDNERTDNLTSTTDMTRKDTGSISNSETDILNGTTRNDNNLKQTTSDNSKSTSKTESYNHSSSVSESNAQDVAKGLVRQLPQSTEYAGASAGFPDKLDWSTGTTQAEDHTDTTSKVTSSSDTSVDSDVTNNTNSNGSVTNTGYTTGSSTQTNEYNKTQTNNTQSKDEGTVKNTGTQNTNESVDEDTKNIRKLDDKHDTFRTEHGFKGMTEAEIRAEIWNYITNSIALQWFIGKMERCFIGIFE